MKKYEFTLRFSEPDIWVYKTIVEAYSPHEAYCRAFYEFTFHILRWNIIPSTLTISYKEL